MILISIFQLLGALTPFDNAMTGEEKRKTGVYKLTVQEKTALQEWIETQYKSTDSANQILPTVQEVLFNGQYVRLSNQTLFQIRPEDHAIAQGWLTSAEIILSPSTNPFFPVKLTNKVSGSTIFGRKTDQLPQESPTLAPKTEEKILSPSSTPPKKPAK